MTQSGRAHDLKQTPLDDMPVGARLLDRLLAHRIDQGADDWCECDACLDVLDDLATQYASVEVGPDLVFIPRDDPTGLCLVLRLVPGDAGTCPTCANWCARCDRLTCHCGEH